jgi:hypothetical protein
MEARSRDRPCWRAGLSCIHRPGSILLVVARSVAKCLLVSLRDTARRALTVEQSLP